MTNPHISVMFIFCEVKFKFKNLQLNYVNLGMIHFIPKVSIQIGRYTSRHVRVLASRDEFLS